ncbi:DUF5916 domain-containing protein [Eisenibacter elegans]|uniref:DUF5916 domain-containing protein n=1 Tax=Eisenibacter elegans TaxID=997 RepID=UPI00068545C3|nr:DUF5916 domain-containing protein [Eisenibacter elegans]
MMSPPHTPCLLGLLPLFLVGFFCQTLIAKPKPPGDNREHYRLSTQYISGEIKIDGILEDTWQQAQVATDFWQQWPADTALAEERTEVRILFSDEMLYISAICYGKSPYVIQTLKRDVGHWDSEGFALVLDPMNQRSNGFLFGVNAGGAQMEGLITVNRYAEEWDAKWYSQTRQYEDRWVVEMAIPFKSLRYDPNIEDWGINFIRNDINHNMYSTWARVPLQMEPFDLGFTGAIHWDRTPQVSKGNVVLIPYLTGGFNRDLEGDAGTTYTRNAGMDAKIAITPTLNLDVTINPDFSQVDVDRQQTNLTRFSLFFPERRNFFLENSDLFANFGTNHVRPFFSRSIGLRNGQPVDIYGGLRLTGNVNKGLRIGVMDIQTAERGDFASQNYFVAAFQQRVLKRSSIRGIMINRQATSNPEGYTETAFNRVAGLEFQFVSPNGKHRSAARYHRSFNPEPMKEVEYHEAFYAYDSRNFYVGGAWERVGDNYITDMGFIPRLYNFNPDTDEVVRLGFTRGSMWSGYSFISKHSRIINQHGPQVWKNTFWLLDGQFNEHDSGLGYRVRFQNTSGIWVGFNHNAVQLPFRLNLIGGDELLPATYYDYQRVNAEYWSDNRKAVAGSVFVNAGGFYNGTLLTYGANMRLRTQPWGNFSINYSRNEVSLPEQFGATNLDLMGATVEFSFSNTMFWTTFFQYNTQINNVNINSRFQWRFKPMSDLFIVYTDNYFADLFKIRNQSLILKISYWLNI